MFILHVVRMQIESGKAVGYRFTVADTLLSYLGIFVVSGTVRDVGYRTYVRFGTHEMSFVFGTLFWCFP